jgi:hypothetical protein
VVDVLLARRDEDSLAVPHWRSIMCGLPPVVPHCINIDSNLVGYIGTLPGNQFAYVDIDMGPPCPEQPQPLGDGDARAHFLGYITPHGGDGRNWLPAPHDSIGLVFEVETNPKGAEYEITYHIWDITMWQGECMNSPRYLTSILRRMDPEPATTGFNGPVHGDSLEIKFPNFDFTVGQPQKYSLHVYDSTHHWTNVPFNPIGNEPLIGVTSGRRIDLPKSLPIFRSLIIAYHRSHKPLDTLWLRSWDYAAHCLVTPEVGGGKDRRMEPYYIAEFQQYVRTITVPYDYDGYTDVGISYGDGMADKWEHDMVPGQDIRYFRPYITLTPHRGMADLDHIPIGREFDGDNLCNFAEYRGFMVALDSTNTRNGHRHIRTNPNRKTVFIHVRQNMGLQDSVREQMPGYIYKMPEMEAYFTDSIRFSPTYLATDDDQYIEESRHQLFNRDINANRGGAGLWYYGFGYPLRYPMALNDTVRAVTFWKWFPSEHRFHPHRKRTANIDSVFGYSYNNYVFGVPGRAASMPNNVYEAIVQIDFYNQIRDDYYQFNLEDWLRDFPAECKKTIAHEFGHCVGMYDIPYDESHHTITIMSGAWRGPTPSRRYFYVTPTDSTYADSSKAEFSIRDHRE